MTGTCVAGHRGAGRADLRQSHTVAATTFPIHGPIDFSMSFFPFSFWSLQQNPATSSPAGKTTLTNLVPLSNLQWLAPQFSAMLPSPVSTPLLPALPSSVLRLLPCPFLAPPSSDARTSITASSSYLSRFLWRSILLARTNAAAALGV